MKTAVNSGSKPARIFHRGARYDDWNRVDYALPQELPPLSRDAILGHLNEAITWYHDTTTKVQAAGLPSDAIYEDNTRNLAAEVVRLAFQSARTEAALITANEKSPNAQSNGQGARATARPDANCGTHRRRNRQHAIPAGQRK